MTTNTEEHTTRAAVLALLTANPASSISQVAQAMGLARSTVAHHRRALLDAGAVQLSAVQRVSHADRVAGAILDNPTASNAQIAAQVGISTTAVRRLRWDLIEAGRIPARPARTPPAPRPPPPPTARELADDLAEQLRTEPMHPGVLLAKRERLVRLLHRAAREGVGGSRRV